MTAQADLFHRLAPFGSESGATFSADRRYRYRLWRSWGDREHRCVFVGLNPSTADEQKDDPTIRKCIGFAKRWGFGALDMVNLFGLRSTDPTGLLRVDDPVGPGNAFALAQAVREGHRIVLCWGKHPVRVRGLVRRELDEWTSLRLLVCLWPVGTLGRNGDGSPRHPLMLPYATPFEPET